MGTESKKHHYVPKNQLKWFCNNKRKNNLYVFDKKSGENLPPCNIKNVGSENYFNTVRNEQSKFNFEDVFDNYDGKLAKILPKIIESESLHHLSNDEIIDLIYSVAVQFLRVKMRRTNRQMLVKDINDVARKAYGRDAQKELDEEEAKLITISGLLRVDGFANSLLNKDVVLFKNISKDKIWTSDNPVVMENYLPYGKIGVDELGIHIFYPISPKLILGLICQSVKENLSSYPQKVSKEELSLFKFLCGNKGTIPVQNISSFNDLQVRNSSRFIYSCDDDFEFAKKIISQNPQLREVKKNRGIQKGNYRNYRMPEGEFAVIYLSDRSFMIPISDVKESVEIQFKSGSIDLFLANVNGKRIERVEFYRNQQIFANYMKEMKIKEMDRNTNTIVLEYKEEEFKTIMELVRNHLK